MPTSDAYRPAYYADVLPPNDPPVPPDRWEDAGHYGRVSADAAEDEPSLPEQLYQAREYAAVVRLRDLDGAVIGLRLRADAIHQEVGDSATRRRPGWQAIYRQAERGEIRHIVALNRDRLGRDNALVAIMQDAAEIGTKLHCVDQPLDGGVGDQVSGLTTGGYRQQVRANTQRGRRSRARHKHAPIAGGKPTYGYRWADDRKLTLVIHEGERAVVIFIFARVAEGVPLRALCAELELTGIDGKAGVPAPKGGVSWRRETLRRIINNDQYFGEAVAFGPVKLVPTGRTRIVNGRAKQIYRKVERPAHERIALPAGTYPAIVTRAEAEAARARLERNKIESPRNNKAPENHLLRGGFIRCGQCGGRVMAENKAYPEYRVQPTRWEHVGCAGRTITAAKADAIVWAHVVAALEDDGVLAERAEAAHEADPFAPDLARLAGQIARVERQKERLFEALEELDEDLQDEALGRVNAKAVELRALRGELATLGEQQEEWRRGQHAGADLATRLATLREILADPTEATYEERRLALRALGVMAFLPGPGADLPLELWWAGEKIGTRITRSMCPNNTRSGPVFRDAAAPVAAFPWTDPALCAPAPDRAPARPRDGRPLAVAR